MLIFSFDIDKRSMYDSNTPLKWIEFCEFSEFLETFKIKGIVEKTLLEPKNLPDKISILRLDTDFYESTKIELEILYPKLSEGGYCIIDDYALSGCNAAVNDYRTKYKINSEIKKIDWTGIYWQK